MTGQDGPLDARTRACVAVAWVIAANKPFYPLYVWWLAGGQAAWDSAATMIGAPFYAAIPLLARRSPFLARAALPAVGTLDTLFATKLFGAAAGTELFLFPCALLAVVVFAADEYRASRIAIVAILVAFLALHGRTGASLAGWSADTGARLFELNAYSVASLVAFIVWRFSGLVTTAREP